MSQHQCRRGPWSNAEDRTLMRLVETHGALNWVRISQTLGSRTPKQCRERYHQNLKPSLNHEPITPEEGVEIERLVGEVGKRWAEIARRLNGRSDNAVKNWWNGSQNRRRRQDRRRATHPVDGHFDSHHSPHPPPPHRHPMPYDDRFNHQARSYAGHQPYYTTHSSSHPSDSLPAPGAFSSSRPSLNIPQNLRLPALPPPQPSSNHCTLPRRPHHRAEHHPHRSHRAWDEVPLPSPCSSDGADSEFNIGYVTSPISNQYHPQRNSTSGRELRISEPLGTTARTQQYSLPLPLPPAPNASSYASSALAQMAPPEQTDPTHPQTKESRKLRTGDLPTAPNSPESPDNIRQVMGRKDPRMHLTTLLA